jgi:NLR family CARD domain-containing protein 3
MAVAASNGNSDENSSQIVDGDHMLRYLAANHPNVQELVCSQVLNDADIDNLSAFLIQNYTPDMQLRSLQLPKNNLTVSCAKALAHIIHSTPTLVDLDLSDNCVKAEGLSIVIDDALAVSTCRLTDLNLSNNKLGGRQGASLIAKLLRDNTSLRTLVLGHNDLGGRNQSMKEILTSLHRSCLLHLDLTANKLGDRGAAGIAEALAAPDGKLQILNLANNKIRYSGAYKLADAFVKHNNTALLKLDLRDNMIEAEGAQAFGSALRLSYTLQELNLSRNNIGDDGLRVIALGLKENRTSALRRLDLSWNGIKDGGARLLADMLMDNSVLTYLNLRCNFICDEGIRALAESLPFPLALDELDLVGNQMRDPTALIDALCHHVTKLEILRCEQNRMSPEAESRLQAAFMFRANKRGWLGGLLREIRERKQVSCNLSTRQHSDEELIAISRHLSKYKPKVTTAMFGGTQVTFRGITILAQEVLSTNSAHLQRLYIRNAPITDIGAAALAQALASNTTLRCLSLAKCHITEDGAKMISNSLRRNSTLTRLSLEVNQIGDKGFREICEAILDPPHPSLISLNVSQNGITDHGLACLLSITKLDELHLGGNNLVTDFGALSLAMAVYGNQTLRWLNVCKTGLSCKGIKVLQMFLHTPYVLDHDSRQVNADAQ